MFKKIVPYLLIISIIISCKTDSRKINPEFIKYVSAFTYGIVSNQSTIKVQLLEEVKNAVAGEEVKIDLFSFSPAIDGKTFWIDKRTIEFRPDKLLPSGKSFEVEFHLKPLIKKIPEPLEVLPFSFHVIQQGITIGEEIMNPLDRNYPEFQKVSGTVTSIDFASHQMIEKSFSASQENKSLKVKWIHDKDERTHYFTIDSVHRKEKRETIKIEIEGNELSVDDQEKIIEIPSLSDFEVFSFHVENEPEQIVTINFSDPLQIEQDLEGLVYVQGENCSYRISGNQLKLYPLSQLVGDKELVVSTGVKNFKNFPLSNEFTSTISFQSLKPDVEIIGSGAILPSTNGLILPFKAVSLKAVDVKIIKVYENNIKQFFQVNQHDGNNELMRVGRVEYRGEIQLVSKDPIDYKKWNTFSLDLSKLIRTDPGALYRVYISFKPKHSLYKCENKIESGDFWTKRVEEEEATFDEGENYWYYGGYYGDEYEWEERENPCHISYYIAKNNSKVINVLASDIGIIAKGGNSSPYVVAITDLRNTLPISNVQVEFYNYQQQLLGSVQTNEDGFASFSSSKKPYLIVAKRGKERGYLRVDDGSSLSLSMFDVSGVQNRKGVKGYIYGERGVWRPGDSLYLSFMLEDKNNVIPYNHPVVIEIYNPHDQLYKKWVKNSSVNDLYDFRFSTQVSDPTGTWTAKVKVGGSEFSKSLKIETVKPNRLKINFDFGKEVLSSKGVQNGKLNAKWLHGAKAKNLKADVEMTIKQGKTAFKGFDDYVFDDPTITFSSQEKKIFEGNLDAEGNADVHADISLENKTSGMLNCFFKTRVFEEGGDFSIDQYQIPYSPYSSYAGIKLPKGKGWNGALNSDETNLINLVKLDEFGKPRRGSVKVEIYSVEWRWWWDYSDEDEFGEYEQNGESKLLQSKSVELVGGKKIFELKFDQASWGRKYIKVTDLESGHSCGQYFYTTYSSWWNEGGHGPGGPEMLTFSTDKQKYTVGETVKIQLPKVGSGRALVSIESGSKVLQHFWHQLNGKQIEFQVTESMAPNVFIHVSLIQPHNNASNDVPIRMYGVQNIEVEDRNTHLNPQVKMPSVIEPEQVVKFSVSEQEGKAMAYTVAIVDEGLLDLTRFKTPDPWPVFYAREALGIKTWDLYKYVMGAYNGKMAGLLAIGGDEALAGDAGKKVNRFKPVVKFLGPFYLEKGKTNQHQFKMPNYVGSVKTMVVACDKGAYGSIEKTTPVKKPLMVLSTLPRVLGPQEKVKVPVTVFAMDKKIKEVKVQIKTSKIFKVVGESVKIIRFNEVGDQVLEFDLQVLNQIGSGKIDILVTGSGEKASHITEVQIRASNPEITEVKSGVLTSGSKWQEQFSLIGMPGTNKVTLELSSLPPLNLEQRLNYLISYPHGCIEQTTSSAFPQLYLTKLMDLTPAQKSNITRNIKVGIDRLKSFQLPEGGMAYWPDYDSEACDWGTTYAGHFLLEAEKMGYTLPAGFKNKWINYQRKKAASWKDTQDKNYSFQRSNQLEQAYRLYTLALSGNADLGSMNRMKEISTLTSEAKWRLAAAYMLAGKEKVAKTMVENLKTNVIPYKELSNTFGSDIRDQAMILETLVALKYFDKGKKVLEDISRQMKRNTWFSTQSTAYCLLAVGKFVGATGGFSGGVSAQCKMPDGSVKVVNVKTPIYSQALDLKKYPGGQIQITNLGKGMLFTKINMKGIPLVGDQSSKANNLSMDVKYFDFKGKEINPRIIEQGTDFYAEVTLQSNSYQSRLEELALIQIFPSGWEIKNTRMDLSGSGKETLADKPEYTDFRDDRVYSYFDIPQGVKRKYRVVLHAAYQGEFYLPTVSCEAMYDNEIYARKGGVWVKVVKSKPADRT